MYVGVIHCTGASESVNQGNQDIQLDFDFKKFVSVFLSTGNIDLILPTSELEVLRSVYTERQC